MKKLYVAATRQNEGKTTNCLGLMLTLPKLLGPVGFMKPVGQRYVTLPDGAKVDEDVVLIHEVCGVKEDPRVMSPIAIERTFTREHIDAPQLEELKKKISLSFEKVSSGKEFVIIEGTGHAGVGSVFGLSNATVAKLLGAKVVIVTGGGIGRPIDEVALNRALFEQHGVEIVGVILNKVLPQKLSEAKKYVGKYLKSTGIELLGAIPFHPGLYGPTVGQITEELGAEVLASKQRLSTRVESIVVAAMAPHQALDYIRDGSLVITPGSREDIILTVIGSHLAGPSHRAHPNRIGAAALLLTGDDLPHENIMRLVVRAHIPVIRVKENTYEAASRVHDLRVKIRPGDRYKIQLARHLIRDHLNTSLILKRLGIS